MANNLLNKLKLTAQQWLGPEWDRRSRHAERRCRCIQAANKFCIPPPEFLLRNNPTLYLQYIISWSPEVCKPKQAPRLWSRDISRLVMLREFLSRGHRQVLYERRHRKRSVRSILPIRARCCSGSTDILATDWQPRAVINPSGGFHHLT